MGEHADLKYEKKGHVLILALNRSAKSNAISKGLLADLSEALARAANDEQVRVVVLRAEGKHFSVGADVDEIKGFMSVADYEDFFRCFHETLNRLENLPKPTIAAINGLALGGGCELSLAADIRIAAENASLALPEIKLGTLPGAGGTQRLPRIVGASKALEIIYTGDSISAQEAYRIGLVNKVVPPEKLKGEAIGFARLLETRPPIALRTAKLLIRQGSNLERAAALELEIKSVSQLAATDDQREGFRAFLEKRDPKFVGR
jgi:enoyl-CoA hydratase